MAEQRWYELAKKVIGGAKLMTLATDEAGNPWAVTVLCNVADGKLAWESFPQTRHSQHVESNPHIAFNVTDGTDNAVYGRAEVVQTEPKDDGHVRYVADISEAWVITDEKVDGQFVPPQQLDPDKL